MSSALVNDEDLLTFTYNADGIRTSKTLMDEYSEYYRLDGDKVVEIYITGYFKEGRYVITYDKSGNPFSFEYYSDGTDTVPDKYYYVLNLQGDVIQLRTADGTIVANYIYDAWGKLLSVTDANGNTITASYHIAHRNPLRYRGYFYDTETGLYYCKSRYYDPEVKRFINPDDIGVVTATPGAFTDKNLYAYCDNNPVMRVDTGGYFWDIIFDVATLGLSIADVVANPTDPLAWVGLAADVVDLLPIVTGVGEVVKAGLTTKKAVEVIDSTHDAVKTADNILDTADDIVDSSKALGACFVAGTLVQHESGLTPIEEIKIGDLVVAWDEETGDVSLRRVVETYINQTDTLIHLFVNGEEIVTTPEHPFYVPTLGWTESAHLRAGDMLVVVNGEYVVLEKVQHELLETPIEVYNFQVEEYHTYYVGCIGVLVHNSCKAHPNGIYEDAPYHTPKGNAKKSPRPLDGQAALDNSVPLDDTTNRRVGISENQIVVLDQTSPGLYHGHVETYHQLSPKQQAVLRKAHMVSKKGKILKW